MSAILAGLLPIPPAPRAAPYAHEEARYVDKPPKRPPPYVPPQKNWEGWVSPSGLLRALRPGRYLERSRETLWWFLCLLCGREVEKLPRRLKNPPHVRTCGCGPRGEHAPKLRAIRLSRIRSAPARSERHGAGRPVKTGKKLRDAKETTGHRGVGDGTDP